MVHIRKRNKRRYNESQDEEGDGERKFDLIELIKSDRFDDSLRDKHLQELPGEAITLRLFQRHGFERPILVTKPDGLDLRVPPKSFLVRDVRNYVGHQRIIDVMDVKTQKNIEMSMKDWCKYYESRSRDRLLNVISLEFSHTRLDELVVSPMIVRLLDWVDLVWPKFLKESQTEGTNITDKMKYPKVQKYCLMSVKGSYTDFHIDFGGTSVWYHILRGKKIFWMVPPTELNLQVFEEWTLSGMQQDVFFGDTVEECFRVELRAGNTFFIPSGWIHAVYTLEDSLVFGGNFLHSFGIENQLKVSRIEDATKVPIKFRYPFYTEILWYVVQHYVYCLTNKDHLHRLDLQAAEAAAAAALAASKEKLSIESNNGKCNNVEIEDETTESEQDEESDSKQAGNSRGSASKRKRNGKGASKSAPKKTKRAPASKRPTKPSTVADSDESTDIDSANEDTETLEDEDEDDDEEEEESPKPAQKASTNTCRMTKNSLLRLQYEVEEQQLKQQQQQQQQTSSAAKKSANNSKLDGDITSSQPGKNSPPKKKDNTSTSASSSSTTAVVKHATKDTSPTVSKQQSSATTTLNLADIVLSHESNGWSNKEGQSVWANHNAEESKEPKKIHITKFEVNGLRVLVKHLSKLSGAKKNLPSLIRNSRALLDDCKKLINEHENDDPELAITGKPITPELLKPKKTDMNELIGQFFKPTETAADEREMIAASNDSSRSSSSVTTLSTTNPSSAKSKSNAEQQQAAAQQHRSKTGSGNSNASGSISSSSHNHGKISSEKDEKKTDNQAHSSNASNSSSSAIESSTGATTKSSSSLSPHKETKCLSPNKKLSNSASTASTSSPPARPKSPPTRPLSNNQYTSKTKNNNNLLLPGSFADLIAATSTEKKVFDVSGADVASSLYGIKDPASSSKQNAGSSGGGVSSSHSTASNKPTVKVERDRLLSGTSVRGSAGSVNKSLDLNHLPASSASASTSGAGTGSYANKPEHLMKSSSSPEPNKLAGHPQKRFITPATFKPQNKEKLIFASAPYINPVHAYDQNRSSNPYPWQATTTPSTPSSQSQQQQQQQPPLPPHHQQYHQHSNYSPSTPRPAPPTYSSSTSVGPTLSPTITQPSHIATVPTTTQTPAATAPSLSSPATTLTLSPTVSPAFAVSSGNVIEPYKPDPKAVSKQNQIVPPSAPSQPPVVESNRPQQQQPQKQQVTEHKPRGPPKKSKEARQVIEETTSKPVEVSRTNEQPKQLQASPSPVPAAVINYGSSNSSSVPTAQQQQPQQEQQRSQKAPRAKRPKKQKDVDSSVATVASSPSSSSINTTAHKLAPPNTQQQAQPANTQATNQVRPSVICGLVRQTPQPQQKPKQTKQKQQKNQQLQATAVSTAAATTTSTITPSAQVEVPKINPQSYIISRPLFSFPAFSAAQSHQMQQQPRPMNLLTSAPMSSPLAGLPVQQGARLVWATQPPRALAAPVPSASSQKSQMTGPATGAASGANKSQKQQVSRQSVVTSHAADNAALLSLATTALSTASMVSSPTLSHLSATRAPGQQAIMVSAAGPTAQPLFAAGQQYLTPYVPARMPMAHFLARPPTAVPTTTTMAMAGQRPPAGSQLVFARLPNQPNQQRYLITQPGFVQRFQAPQLMSNQLFACHLLSAGGGVRAQGAQDAQVRGSK